MPKQAVKWGYSLCVLLVISGLKQAGAAELDHDSTSVEQIIVTSSLHRSQADTTLPVNVLDGEALRERVGATLGDTLQDQVGITTASFGAGVGAPVIRGQGANRVQVLQGGVGNIDASSISPDHANSLEPALADRIEVLRGPATLLYGNGAIGGVVNVIDNRIPTMPVDGLTGLIESRHNSASDQQVTVLKLEGGGNRFVWHVDGVHRESNDVEVSGYAINPETVDMTNDEARDQLLQSRGVLQNSSTESEAKTLGGSWMLPNSDGYVGLSVNKLNNNYGIPAAAHVHDDETGHVNDEDASGEEGVRIVMQQQRTDFETRIPLSGFFDELHGRMSHVDYQHKEVESTGEIGTVFKQTGSEGRFALHFANSVTAEGVLGLNFSQREFSALGEEAFIPTTDIGSVALFAMQSFDVGDRIYEFGFRGERQSLKPTTGCAVSDTSWSGSASSIWRIREDTNVVLALSHSQRSATVEERFSNITEGCGASGMDTLVAHAATQRFEIGNPHADKERATNIELGLRKHLGAVTGEVNVYYNDIADYIYLYDTGEFIHSFEISRYQQDNAVFRGFEAELNLPLRESGEHLTDLKLFGDYVRATFDRRGNVPQIPPLSYGVELRHSHTDWQVKLRLTQIAEQNKAALGETPTRGYALLNFYADYHLQFGGDVAYLFVKGSNLLDETIRQHTSLLKDVAPAAGRAIEAGLRWEF